MFVGELVIVPFGFGWRLGRAYRFDLGVGELFDRERPTIPALEAFVLPEGKDHEPVPSVTSDGKRRFQGFLLEAPEFALKLARRDALDCGIHLTVMSA